MPTCAEMANTRLEKARLVRTVAGKEAKALATLAVQLRMSEERAKGKEQVGV
jgi:hypothetical protein